MHRTLFGLIVVLLLGIGAAAGAQVPGKAPNTAQMKAVAKVTAQANSNEAVLRDLIKTLESDGDRKKLISQLNALLDAIYSFEHQFQLGDPPPAPYPMCGADPEPVTHIGCDSTKECL